MAETTTATGPSAPDIHRHRERRSLGDRTANITYPPQGRHRRPVLSRPVPVSPPPAYLPPDPSEPSGRRRGHSAPLTTASPAAERPIDQPVAMSSARLHSATLIGAASVPTRRRSRPKSRRRRRRFHARATAAPGKVARVGPTPKRTEIRDDNGQLDTRCSPDQLACVSTEK